MKSLYGKIVSLINLRSMTRKELDLERKFYALSVERVELRNKLAHLILKCRYLEREIEEKEKKDKKFQDNLALFDRMSSGIDS